MCSSSPLLFRLSFSLPFFSSLPAFLFPPPSYLLAVYAKSRIKRFQQHRTGFLVWSPRNFPRTHPDPRAPTPAPCPGSVCLKKIKKKKFNQKFVRYGSSKFYRVFMGDTTKRYYIRKSGYGRDGFLSSIAIYEISYRCRNIEIREYKSFGVCIERNFWAPAISRASRWH